MADTPEAVKTVETLYSLVPVVGPVFSATFKFLEFTGYFGSTDPLAAAVRALQREMTALTTRLNLLEQRVNQLAVLHGHLDNQVRANKLQERRLALDRLLNRIAGQPQSVSERNGIQFDAWQVVQQFIDDPDLWLWTDLEITYQVDAAGQPTATPAQVNLLPPDFKTTAALPLYAYAVLTWLIAIDLETGGNVADVRAKVGAKLRQHTDHCRVRAGFDELSQAPVTFAEQVMSRITCFPVAQHKFALGNQCRFSIVCDNLMERRRTSVGEASLDMPAGTSVLCQAPSNMGLSYEAEVEAAQGVAPLSELADLMERVATRGSLREQLVGVFVPSPNLGFAFLYTVGQNGDLTWYRQDPNAAAGSFSVVGAASGWHKLAGFLASTVRGRGDALWTA